MESTQLTSRFHSGFHPIGVSRRESIENQASSVQRRRLIDVPLLYRPNRGIVRMRPAGWGFPNVSSVPDRFPARHQAQWVCDSGPEEVSSENRI